MRRILSTAALLGFLGLSSAPARADVAWFGFGPRFLAGGVNFVLSFGQPGLHYPRGNYYRTNSLIVSHGARCSSACFHSGAVYYHHESCPLIRDHFVRLGYDPYDLYSRYAPRSYFPSGRSYCYDDYFSRGYASGGYGYGYGNGYGYGYGNGYDRYDGYRSHSYGRGGYAYRDYDHRGNGSYGYRGNGSHDRMDRGGYGNRDRGGNGYRNHDRDRYDGNQTYGQRGGHRYDGNQTYGQRGDSRGGHRNDGDQTYGQRGGDRDRSRGNGYRQDRNDSGRGRQHGRTWVPRP